MFRANGKGFQLTFANGWTVSVQFGAGNYCENRSFDVSSFEKHPTESTSVDAEIAAWDENGVWFDFGSDTVKGWCSANEVGAFIQTIQAKGYDHE